MESLTVEEIKETFPLHWLVWNNEYEELETVLAEQRHEIEKLDSRGRTPLMLAVKLSHLQSVKALLAAKSNANTECDGWSVVQEAVCAGDPAVLIAVLEVRDLQRHMDRTFHVPKLLQNLKDAPDFYIEMTWEFTSWVPLMSRMCPSDTYKIYKRGSNVRIDTTLLGFDNTSWQRGSRSYIFKGDDDSATMIEVDHDAREVSIEHMKSVIGEVHGIPPLAESVTARLTTPITTNNINMEKISFERNKSGIWGWRSEKMETINNYECKVYAASNVEFITRTRNEHLNEEHLRIKNSRTPLQNFLGFAGEESGEIRPLSPVNVTPEQESQQVVIVTPVTAEEYFSSCDMGERDIGRPKRLSTKVQRFKANLWLSEEFPIKLQEQVLPILDLMSTMASPHVSKLKDFITMQLPAGFPVKIEIPLFHILNACVTFGNVFSLDTPVEHVEQLQENDRLSCIIDDQCFVVPPTYTKKGSDYRRHTYDDEDDLMQYAIQQSLVESGSETDQVDIWEALRARRPSTPNILIDDDAQFQRVLQESLFGFHAGHRLGAANNDDNRPNRLSLPQQPSPTTTPETELEIAIRLSQQEQLARETEIEQEQRMIDEALRMSLQDL